MTPSQDDPPRPEPAAVGTSPDIEWGLRRMYDVKREIEALEQEYEQLRDTLALQQFGSAYFVGPDHQKHYGYVVNPEKVEIDPDLIDELDEALREEVAPRKIVSAKLKQAIATGRITEDVVARHLRIKPGTSHIRFGVMED